MATKEEILDAIGEMSVLELSELLKDFEDRFDVTAAAPMAAVAVAPSAGDGDEEAEEKDSFDVVLTGAGDKKIQVIKEVRSLTNLGLKDAKELVDEAPSSVLEGASKEDAEKAKEALEAAGASDSTCRLLPNSLHPSIFRRICAKVFSTAAVRLLPCAAV